jgi:hypothetical protein
MKEKDKNSSSPFLLLPLSNRKSMQQTSSSKLVPENSENESDEEIQIIKIVGNEKGSSREKRASAASNSRQNNTDTKHTLYEAASDDIVEIDSKGKQVASQPFKKRDTSYLADVTYIGSTEPQSSYMRDGRIESHMTFRDVVTSNF